MSILKGRIILDVLNDIGRPASIEEIYERLFLIHPEVTDHLLDEIKTAISVGVRRGDVNEVEENSYAMAKTLKPIENSPSSPSGKDVQ